MGRKFKQQLKEKANYEAVRAKLKAGNALTQRFVRANVKNLPRKPVLLYHIKYMTENSLFLNHPIMPIV